MAESGFEIEVFCGMPNYPQGRFYPGYNYFYPRSENHNGIHIKRVGEIPQWKKGGRFFVSLNYLWFPFASFYNLPRILFKHYDCVFIYGLSPVFMGFPGIIYSRLRGVKSVYYILDYWPDSLYSIIPLKNKFLRWALRKISFWHYKNSSLVLATSKGVLEKLRSDTGVSEDRSFFLPQSCSAIYESPVYNRELHERYGDKFNLVYAGNIGPAQSLETLIEAIHLLKHENAELEKTFRVIFVGDGMSRPAIQAKVESLDLSDYFIFEGHVPEERVLEFNELADALFVSLADDPLFSIMLPAKIQSCMAAGKPILAAINGDGADTIKEAGCGIACRSGNPRELAASIKEFMSLTKEKRGIMGNNGREYYSKNYRHVIFMERLLGYLGVKEEANV